MATQAGVSNLDGRAQNMQLRVGVAGITLGLAVAVAMSKLGASTALYLLLFPLFFAGAYGIGAGLFGICGMCALFGRRLSEGGSEPVADRAELAKLRRRGTTVIATSALASALATLLLSFASR
jgi:hypothetical protein